MWFWWFMSVCDLLIPVLCIVAGRMMWKHCPKQINGLVGYRTSRSMKNMETWKFAHAYCGKLWWKFGWITLAFSALAQILCVHSSEGIIGITGGVICTIQCILLVISIVLTEKELKKRDEEH